MARSAVANQRAAVSICSGGTPQIPATEQMRGGVKQPEEVAERVVRAIDRGQLYILTHEEQREILKRRADRLDAVFAPEAWGS